MEKNTRIIRHFLILTVLLLGVVWSLASAQQRMHQEKYPNGHLLLSAEHLKTIAGEDDTVIVDVRTDEYFDGRIIPGAIRLPWTRFRYNDTAMNEASRFIGADAAQKILGEHGIGRTDTVVLYDSVARDGGATATYLFLILDILGHDSKMVLEGGLEKWVEAGYELASRPRVLSPLLYQAPMAEMAARRIITGAEIYSRLGDPHYQVIDVRSEDEYTGKKGTKDLRGRGLKLGHIPTAVNINYEDNWIDQQSKNILPYEKLLDLYRGISPQKSIVVYCNSGRRSSFSYFILRLMGFERVRSYEASWKEWGKRDNFFPVELQSNQVEERMHPISRSLSSPDTSGPDRNDRNRQAGDTGEKPQGGYVSCGG